MSLIPISAMALPPLLEAINYGFSILISFYLSLMDTAKNITLKELISFADAVLMNEPNEGKKKYIVRCYKKWARKNKQKLITDKLFPLQNCSDAWDNATTPYFIYSINKFSDYIIAFLNISTPSTTQRLINMYENTFNKSINDPIYTEVNNNQVQLESNFNVNNLKNAIISNKTLLTFVLVSMILTILPFIIEQKDTILKWLSTQSNVLEKYIKDYFSVVTNYFKKKQEKAILKTINQEVKLSKRKSRKNRSLLKKGGIRSLKN
jgi:hypothetical protein